MKVRFKKLTPSATAPTKAHKTDVGYDLYVDSANYDLDGNIVYGTGIAMEIPEGYGGFIFPRSSNARYSLALTNCVGIIDPHYRGEIMAKFKPSMSFIDNHDSLRLGYSDQRYEVGDRFGQIVVMQTPEVEFEESDELSETDRGAGGYGSSGR